MPRQARPCSTSIKPQAPIALANAFSGRVVPTEAARQIHAVGNQVVEHDLPLVEFDHPVDQGRDPRRDGGWRSARRPFCCRCEQLEERPRASGVEVGGGSSRISTSVSRPSAVATSSLLPSARQANERLMAKSRDISRAALQPRRCGRCARRTATRHKRINRPNRHLRGVGAVGTKPT